MKIRKIGFTFTLILSCTLLLGQKSVKLTVPKIPQKSKDWCWAASMEMIMKYHDPSILSDDKWQCRLGRNYHNISMTTPLPINTDIAVCPCADCNSICTGTWVKRIKNFTTSPPYPQYFDLLFSYYAYHSNEDTLRMSWGDVTREIDNCRPFIAVLLFNDAMAVGGGQHAVVVNGYEESETESGEMERYLWIYDPLRSCVGDSEFCDVNDPATCEYVACKGCEYRMVYDMCNRPVTKNLKLRAVGYIHDIHPIRDTTCSSCDSIRIAHTVDANMARTRAVKTNDKSRIVESVTIPVKYIDYGKMLNTNFRSIRLDSYFLPVSTREILTNEPTPQSKSQELINGEWKTVIIRDLKELPKIKINMNNFTDTLFRTVILKNQASFEGRNVIPYSYVHYTPLLYLFYRFSVGGKSYLSPTSPLRHPLTGEIFAKAGSAYDEKTMIAMLKKITIDYEKDAQMKYEKNDSYTR